MGKKGGRNRQKSMVKRLKIVGRVEKSPECEFVKANDIDISKVNELGEVGNIIQAADANELIVREQVTDVNQMFMVCKNCFLQESCPFFNASERCALKLDVRIETASDIKGFIHKLLSLQAQRIMRQHHFELQGGGVATKEMSNEMMKFIDMLKGYKDIVDSRDSIEIKAKGHGIVSEIFGNMFKDKKEQVD